MAFPGLLGGLANMGAVVGGADQAQAQALKRAVVQLQLRQAQQQDQSLASIYGGALQLGQGGGGGMPQGMPSSQPGQVQQQPLPPPQQQAGGDQVVKGSWFGSQPGWTDTMSGPQTASGTPLSVPGIALRDPIKQGQALPQYDVTAPNGVTLRLPQTDVGPGRTGKAGQRGVDINSAAAQEFGYTEKNFPTDQKFRVHPVVQREVQQTGMEAIKAGLPPPAVRESSSAATGAASALDPQKFGSYNAAEIAQAIERATPNAPVAVKALALMQLHKMMAPDQQQLVRAQMQQMKNELTIGLKEATLDMQRESLAERERHDRALEARPTAADTPHLQPLTVGDKTVAFDTKSGKTTEIPELAGATRMGGGGQAGGAPLTDAAAERYAKIFNDTGYLPPGIARSSKAIAQIMNKTGDTGSPGDFVAKVGTTKANINSLQNMTKLADAATSYENTAIRNFDQALQYADKGISTDMGPWLNRWVATGRVQFGDEKVPPYVTALLTAANEYAKVMTGSTGAAAATEGARREAAEFFSPYFSQGQIKEVITVAKQEMENRRQELYSSVDDIKNRLRSAGSGAPTSTGHAAGAPQDLPPGFAEADEGTGWPRGGKVWVKKGGKLIEAPGGEATPR